MMAALLVAGIGILSAGLLAIGFGIPVKEFSFGNTLIIAGAVAACSGLVMLGLWTVVRELRMIAGQLGGVPPVHALAPLDIATATHAADNEGFLFSQDEAAIKPDPALQGSAPPPWLDETARARGEPGPAPESTAEPASPVKQRRNLLFSSSSRKERDRAQARAADPMITDIAVEPVAVAPPPEPAEPPPATFDDAWPKSERTRGSDVSRRNAGRAPSTFAETGTAVADRHPPAARNDEQLPVTVLKSGVVDGMAYSLYSDGSIEAQMPEGMMRFVSIDELRSHLDQRP